MLAPWLVQPREAFLLAAGLALEALGAALGRGVVEAVELAAAVGDLGWARRGFALERLPGLLERLVETLAIALGLGPRGVGQVARRLRRLAPELRRGLVEGPARAIGRCADLVLRLR